jgi:hypothetical protein
MGGIFVPIQDHATIDTEVYPFGEVFVWADVATG